MVCLYIFIFIIHYSTGCNLTNDQKRIDVTGYTGGSVLLPCSCDDPQSTVNTFTWEIWHNGSQWMNAFKKHRGRFKLFNETSPANLSLLISDFREEDEGIYRCITEPRSFTDVFLKVTGCDLDQQTQTIEVTGYLGESVVLPCSCTESLTKPDKIKWKFIEKNDEEIYPSEHNERYKNRRKLINQTTPGNLSLHLSSLTKEDQGVYLCSVYNSYIYIRLYIEEKPEVYTIYSSTHQPSQHELITTQQPENKITHQTHNTTVYICILIALFSSVLLFLVFNSWGCKGCKNIKNVTSDAPKLSREPENEDEAIFSGVFYVNQHQHQPPCRMVQ